MKELLRDYGAAIGPALAFLLGVLAVYIHRNVNTYLERARTLRKFGQLKKLIDQYPPPTKFFQGKVAQEIDNARNFAVFRYRVITTKVAIDKLEEEIYRYGEMEDIQQFNNIKYHHDFLMKSIQEFQTKTYDIDAYNSLVLLYEFVKKATENPTELLHYKE